MNKIATREYIDNFLNYGGEIEDPHRCPTKEWISSNFSNIRIDGDYNDNQLVKEEDVKSDIIIQYSGIVSSKHTFPNTQVILGPGHFLNISMRYKWHKLYSGSNFVISLDNATNSCSINDNNRMSYYKHTAFAQNWGNNLVLEYSTETLQDTEYFSVLNIDIHGSAFYMRNDMPTSKTGSSWNSNFSGITLDNLYINSHNDANPDRVLEIISLIVRNK